MAIAIQKITLDRSRDIAFDKLVLSQSNVRRIKHGLSIEELADDIERRGLLQSLNVRPVLNADGAESGRFEVPAGGRRYRALALLVKRKKLVKTAPVPCIVRDANSPILAEEDSLAENVRRMDLHPLDQFRAFRALLEKGQCEEEIAARFFVTPAVVRQRLRLITVSEKLLSVYEEDGMRLDQLMAFSISDDHARQEQVWDTVANSHNREPHLIRRMLTEKTVRASDYRVRFAGLDAYVAAGGRIMRDLFAPDDGGWLEDVAILDRLVQEKLAAAAEAIRAEGWKWVETALAFPWNHKRGFQTIEATPVPLSGDEAARIEALQIEREAIEAEYAQADELPDAVNARLGEIEVEIETLEARPVIYDPADISRAGVFVSPDTDGTLMVERGFVRPEDLRQQVDEGDQASGDPDGQSDREPGEEHPAAAGKAQNPTSTGEEPEEDGLKPLPDRLLTELSAWRTLALRDAFALNPHIAVTELLHTLVRSLYWMVPGADSLEADVRDISLPVLSSDLPGSIPAQALKRRKAEWQRELPEDDDALWHWLDRLDETSRQALLAHCLSFGINALYDRAMPQGRISPRMIDERLARAGRLATVLQLDLVEAGWQPTVDNYLGRVTKTRILEAVREARGDEAADRIAYLKKPDMAQEAERLLEGSGWLPVALRTPASVDKPTDVPVADIAAE
ncbi:ParB N-terminal domain-containing protein [Gluconacetobacter aggeris]|uniref:ParB N-terminal domain-containing protein n=1 Tax=Gluconacetobacter aggeris TaxID=1286186 RepID=A0A7W4IVD4_9PROT|nr:ParB/RepB/Spo0J family partition protein [Gluconacetobacter aggeris]MBB2169653.1 ParB N-terminal domain-containing protein [Gluconacetobacter aggeris]